MSGLTGRTPAVFFGHGSPMNALGGPYAEAWRAFGRAFPRPRAILMISAHWYVPETAATAMAAPRTIHDFYGFPAPLYEMRYPAPGDTWGGVGGWPISLPRCLSGRITTGGSTTGPGRC